jgi:hypothetical protein
MGKKIVTIIVLLLVLGAVAWGIYDLMQPKHVQGTQGALIR